MVISCSLSNLEKILKKYITCKRLVLLFFAPLFLLIIRQIILMSMNIVHNLYLWNLICGLIYFVAFVVGCSVVLYLLAMRYDAVEKSSTPKIKKTIFLTSLAFLIALLAFYMFVVCSMAG